MIGEPDRVKEADAPRRCAAQRSCAAALRAVGYAKDTPEPLVDPSAILILVERAILMGSATD